MSLRGAYPADRDGRVVHGAERLAGSPSSGSRQAPTQACEIIPKLRKRAIGVDGRAERFGDLLAVCDSELFRKLASGQGEDIFLEQERSRARGQGRPDLFLGGVAITRADEARGQLPHGWNAGELRARVRPQILGDDRLRRGTEDPRVEKIKPNRSVHCTKSSPARSFDQNRSASPT